MSLRQSLYGIIDSARDPMLFEWIKTIKEKRCLFVGDIARPLDAAAPYIVRLDGEEFLDVWRRDGWGQSWGIMLQSAQTIDDLRAHFRKFLMCIQPDGTISYFRFYDPRVWRPYWATLTQEEKSKWLQGVSEFLVEPETT